MKTKRTLIPLAIASAAILSLAPNKAEAAYCANDLSSQAHRIDSIAHELEDEFRLHFRHLGAYRHLRSDIARVIAEAHHIDRLSHNVHASLRHIAADLRDLDRLAHHMHEVVDAAERGRYGGHVHGDTRHVHSLLSSLNRSIHSMQRIVEDMRHYEDDFHGHGSGHYDGHARVRDRVRFGVDTGRFRFAFARH